MAFPQGQAVPQVPHMFFMVDSKRCVSFECRENGQKHPTKYSQCDFFCDSCESALVFAFPYLRLVEIYFHFANAGGTYTPKI